MGAESGWADWPAERGRKRESTDCSARAQRCVIFENEVGCRKKEVVAEIEQEERG
jgi:hypothetical protein